MSGPLLYCVLTLPHSFTQDGGRGGADGPDSAHASVSLEVSTSNGDLQRNAIISECAAHDFCGWKHWKGIPWKNLLRGEDKTDFGVLVFSDHEHFTGATPMDIPPLILESNLNDEHAMSCINNFNLAFMMLVKDGGIYRATDETILDTIRVNDIHTEMADSLQKAITRSGQNVVERSIKRAKATSRASKGLTVKYKDCDPIPKEHISAELYLSVLQEKRRRIGTLTPVQYLNTGSGKSPLEAVGYMEVGSGKPSGSGQDAVGSVNAKMGVDGAVSDDDQPEEVKVDEGGQSGGKGVGSDEERQGQQEIEQQAPPAKKRRFGQHFPLMSASPKVDTRTTADLARQMKTMVAPLGPGSPMLIRSSHAARVAQETSDVAQEAMAIVDEATGSGKTTNA